MNANALQRRAVFGLNRQESIGQAGHLRIVSLLARLMILGAVAVRLHMLTSGWETLPDADLTPRLWLLLAGAWGSVTFMAALATLQTALSRNEIGIKLPMPLDHANRWRLVLLRVASSFGVLGIGGPLVTVAVVARFGLAWGIVALLLLPAALCVGVLLPLFIAWLFGNGTPRRRAITITLAIPALLAFAMSRATGNPDVLANPVLMVPDAILIPAVVIGIGARRLGRWYLALAQDLHAAPVRARDYLGPISRILGALLSRSRTPWAAIALKELRVQARDVFLLLRIAVMLAAPPLFIAISGIPALADIDTTRLIAAWALLLSVYCAIETTPSPFGGEGNRLSLALMAAPDAGSLIAGKALAVIAPLVAQAWIVIFAITIWQRPPLFPMLGYAAIATLGVVTAGFVMTCLSARDIDLDQPVEGGAQAMLVEHVPASPRRLVIIGAALVITIGLAVAIVALPWPIAVIATISGSALACALTYRVASGRLSRLI